jgi:ribosomal-protein-alanine N-acetyltransferase
MVILSEEECRMKYHWMTKQDMPAVLGLEKLCFPVPWTEQEFLEHLTKKNIIGKIYKINNSLVAYSIQELYNTKIELISLAVHPEFQRKGIGTKIVKSLISKLNSNRSLLEVSVSDTNLTMHLFLKHLGFKAKKTLKVEKQDFYLFEYFHGKPLSYSKHFDEVCEGK